MDEIAPGVIIENNTAFKTGQESGMQAIFCISSSPQLINNIVIGGDRGVRTYGGIPHLYYNNVWGSNTYYLAEGGGIIDTVIGNIHQDPMFVDSLDFHLQMHSPCIDAGHPDIKDPDSSRSDMGAFGGHLGESYVYQDLPPKAPDSPEATLVDSMVILLNWKDNTESDLAYYLIYRDTLDGFIPDTFMVIAMIDKDTSFYQDFDFDFSHNYYYRVRAYDGSLQGGDFSNQAEVKFTSVFPWDDDPENLPRTYELSQNYPNPFNPQTTISYYLPNVGYQPAEVELKIYNLLGKLVRTLVSERQYPGTHRVSWDGTDDTGEEVASGTYFYELKVSGIPFVSAKKMVLVR